MVQIVHLSPSANERLGYPTQKPEALLERIIKTSSNEDDLILNCFVGSGTTAAVAEKLNRRWIACDLGRFAIHTTRKRLLGIEGVRPFIVQNLGKYERQLWQTGQFAKDGPETPEQADQRHRAYVAFILDLYGAKPLSGRTWLHGVKGGLSFPKTSSGPFQASLDRRRSFGARPRASTRSGRRGVIRSRSATIREMACGKDGDGARRRACPEGCAPASASQPAAVR